jgi:hypothetical protein
MADMGVKDAVGDAATGGIRARVPKPKATENRGFTHERACLNCGTELTDAYCAHCGQNAHVHRSLRAFGADLFAGMFNFEGKIWRTLPMLAWRPGELTRRFIAGERARYVSPAALYLFSVFAMFAVLSFNGALDTTGQSVRMGMENSLKAQQREVAELNRRLTDERAAHGPDVGKYERRLKAAQAEVEDLQRIRSGQLIRSDAKSADVEQVPSWARDAVNRAAADPSAVVRNIQDAASKYSWLLIPVSVPFMWLLFPFSRRFRLFDHTVFVTYSLSFMMMLAIIGGLLVAANLSNLASMLFLVPPWHMYRQMRGAYELTRWSALLRTFALVIFCFIAALLFAMALVAIGLF